MNTALVQQISHQLRQKEESFSDNAKLLMLFKFMSYLKLTVLEQFLKVELNKIAEIVSKVCEKEDQVLQHFRRHYDSE